MAACGGEMKKNSLDFDEARGVFLRFTNFVLAYGACI